MRTTRDSRASAPLRPVTFSARVLFSLLAVVLAAPFGTGNIGHAQRRATEQSILGPGLYVFQTRITAATCGDAERTGYVNSYFAAIDGIPASTEMHMNLLNSSFWPRWELQVRGQVIRGSASQPRVNGQQRFELRVSGERFTGTGTRSYDMQHEGRTRRCEVTYDALLSKLD